MIRTFRLIVVSLSICLNKNVQIIYINKELELITTYRYIIELINWWSRPTD